MSMSRRSFLASVLSAAAGGVLLTSPSIAQALILAPPEDPIVRIVSMAREVRVLSQLVRAEREMANQVDRNRPRHWVDVPSYGAFLTQFDDLTHYMMDTFTEDPHYGDLRILFEHMWVLDDGAAGEEETLRHLVRSVIPVYMVKSLIAVDKIPLDTTKSQSFERFAERYRLLIFGPDSIVTRTEAQTHPLRPDLVFEVIYQRMRRAETPAERAIMRSEYFAWVATRDRPLLA